MDHQEIIETLKSSQGSLANNSSERLSKSSEKALSSTNLAGAVSSTEILTSELSAIKIQDSKENLNEKLIDAVEVQAKNSSQASITSVKKDNLSSSKLSNNNLSSSNLSTGNLSSSKLNNDNLSSSKLSNSSASKLNNSTTGLAAKVKRALSIKSNKSSTDKLEAVSLNEPAIEDEKQFSSENIEKKDSEGSVGDEAIAVTAVVETSDEIVPVEGEEAAKKSCISEKSAKCRCIIS